MGPRERRRQLFFQRTFSTQILEGATIAAAQTTEPNDGRALLLTFAQLERETSAPPLATRVLSALENGGPSPSSRYEHGLRRLFDMVDRRPAPDEQGE